MVSAAQHPWILTGPWYRWPSPYDPNSGRQARPVFQKFDDANFVNGFLKDPQHSLKFLVPDDVVGLAGGNRLLKSMIVRKLYLDIHKRFYLVVCELYCDAAGFPNVDRAQVCEAGFVIRRRVARIPRGLETAVADRLTALARSKMQIAEIDALPGGMRANATLWLRAQLSQQYTAQRTDLQLFGQESGVTLALEGWFPSDHQGVGSWKTTTEEPQVIDEAILPLYPLVADPRIPNFSGGPNTIYFGVLPTLSADVDAAGNARFDENTLYEVRCYVRRHKPGCPKRLGRNDCHGELVWSRRTESYQLANPFDLTGTSNRTINIFLPDLPALEAQAKALKPGQGAPVRLIAPPKSNLEFTMSPPDITTTVQLPGGPGAAICSFSIPLITIVATFLLRLFLPIVVLIFQLWFLLSLKFCIPPMLSLGAGLSGQLSLALGELDAGVDVDVAIDATLLASLQGLTDPTTGKPLSSFVDSSGQPYGKEDLARFVASQSTDFSSTVPPGTTVDPSPAGVLQPTTPNVVPGSEWEKVWEVRV